jgi:hypothetical protein
VPQATATATSAAQATRGPVAARVRARATPARGGALVAVASTERTYEPSGRRGRLYSPMFRAP